MSCLRHNSWPDGQLRPGSSGFWVLPCRQSAPKWNARHHRPILPWTWPLSGSADALDRTFCQAYSRSRTVSPREAASGPNPLMGLRLVALMFFSLNQRYQIHPAHRRPFSVLMRLTPDQSRDIFWSPDQHPV